MTQSLLPLGYNDVGMGMCDKVIILVTTRALWFSSFLLKERSRKTLLNSLI